MEGGEGEELVKDTLNCCVLLRDVMFQNGLNRRAPQLHDGDIIDMSLKEYVVELLAQIDADPRI